MENEIQQINPNFYIFLQPEKAAIMKSIQKFTENILHIILICVIQQKTLYTCIFVSILVRKKLFAQLARKAGTTEDNDNKFASIPTNKLQTLPRGSCCKFRQCVVNASYITAKVGSTGHLSS